jgi:hypothetical protein
MRSPIKKGQIRAKGSKNKSRPGRIDNSKNVLDIADNTTFIRSQVLTCVSNTFQIVCWLKLLWRCGTLWFALQISLSCHRTWHFTNPSASTTTLSQRIMAWAKPKWKSHWVPGGYSPTDSLLETMGTVSHLILSRLLLIWFFLADWTIRLRTCERGCCRICWRILAGKLTQLCKIIHLNW